MKLQSFLIISVPYRQMIDKQASGHIVVQLISSVKKRIELKVRNDGGMTKKSNIRLLLFKHKYSGV